MFFRFLKEFSDFETYNTPSFKHPPIIGLNELRIIGLLKEIQNVEMYKKPESKRNNQILSKLESKNMEKISSHEEFRQYYIQKVLNMMSKDSEIIVNTNKFL